MQTHNRQQWVSLLLAVFGDLLENPPDLQVISILLQQQIVKSFKIA